MVRSMPSMLPALVWASPMISLQLYRHLWCQFSQGTAIYLPFERNDLSQWIPVADPAPAVELRLAGQVHAHAVFIGIQAQQKPFLLLTNAYWLAVATHHTLWQPVAQPAAGAAENFDILPVQADFFIEFAIQCFLCSFARMDTALRELPGVLVYASGPKYLA